MKVSCFGFMNFNEEELNANGVRDPQIDPWHSWYARGTVSPDMTPGAERCDPCNGDLSDLSLSLRINTSKGSNSLQTCLKADASLRHGCLTTRNLNVARPRD